MERTNDQTLRQVAAGAAAGLLAGTPLAVLMLADGVERAALVPLGPPLVQVILHFVAAVIIGIAIGGLFRRQTGGTTAQATGGLTIGLLWWVIGPLTVVPLLQGVGPAWSLAEAGEVFSNLVGSLLVGTLAGLLVVRIRLHLLGPIASPVDGEGVKPTQVLVLGGGFGGLATAQRLERLALAGANIEVSLVSPSNSLLFTPMLAEVAGSALEPQHISAPIRASCPRTRFYRGVVEELDLDRKQARLRGSSVSTLRYDHVVVALGSVPNYRDIPGIEEHSMTLKSLQDATNLRNHVIGMLERADVERDPAARRRQLTFVVAGGGFAGTETIAEIFDLVHNARRYYPHIRSEEMRFVLVHSRDRILPEIGPELAEYARRKLDARGIDILLNTRVAGATADTITLGDDLVIPTGTIVWAAGNQPNPVIGKMAAERGRGGALVVDDTMQLEGREDAWAIGDCALIPDAFNEGAYYPPTAQHALREGKKVAENIAAVVGGEAPRPFVFEAIGILVALGHRTAVAEIRGIRFSGLLAWMMWRGVYLSKLPGLEKKVRVLLDWTIDLVFPRDIVLTTDSSDLDPEADPDAGPEPEPDLEPAAVGPGATTREGVRA